jgi:hypothetical protein
VVGHTPSDFIDNSEPTPEANNKSEEEVSESSGGEDGDEYIPHKRVIEDQPLAENAANQSDVSEGHTLVTTNQTDFTVTAKPTRIGRLRRTRDMAEIHACVCGIPVGSEEIESGRAAMCTERGCETQWVSATAYLG